MHNGTQFHKLSLVSRVAYHPKISQRKANTVRVKSAKEILNLWVATKRQLIAQTVATGDWHKHLL